MRPEILITEYFGLLNFDTIYKLLDEHWNLQLLDTWRRAVKKWAVRRLAGERGTHLESLEGARRSSVPELRMISTLVRNP